MARWWGDPAIRLAQFDATAPACHAIIAQGERAVGYVRWERTDPDALAAIGLTEIPEGAVDLDIFIGDPEAAGRGVGPAALRSVFDHLKTTTRAPLVGLCSSVENRIAHRAFVKAGCSRIAWFTDDVFGPCWVYARDLTEHQGDPSS